jgi:uncharacterized membrane protein YbhN (UPF0104 family)
VKRGAWTWARVAGSLLILAAVVWKVGTGPFVDGFHTVDLRSLVLAAAIVLLTTLCCAWRWRLLAGGLGVGLPLPAALASYYRALFLNVALPLGVLGDVHRAVRHGRDVGDVGRGARSVVWDRVSGQTVQIVVAGVVLLLAPSPVRSETPLVAVLVVAAVVLVAVLAGYVSRREAIPGSRGLRATIADVRDVVLARRVWPGVLLTSVLVVLGNTTLFVLAAHTAGVSAPLSQLVPLAQLALLAMSVPLSIAGWGPREGVAAWAFGAAGLGAAAGVSTAVVYGVLVFASTLPGAVVLLVSWRRHAPVPAPPEPLPSPERASALQGVERLDALDAGRQVSSKSA